MSAERLRPEAASCFKFIVKFYMLCCEPDDALEF